MGEARYTRGRKCGLGFCQGQVQHPSPSLGLGFLPFEMEIIIPVDAKVYQAWGKFTAIGETAKRDGGGGGARNSRELRGAYSLHGNAGQSGEEAGFGNPELEVLKMQDSQRKLPPPWRKAS